MIKATYISSQLKSESDPVKKDVLQRFFKTNIGQYGYGDIFLGVTVPKIRAIAKANKKILLDEVLQLLSSPIHEERLIALYFMIEHYKSGDNHLKNKIFELYLANTKYINNWDLVDSSAEYIIGDFLLDKPKDILFELAESDNLWERRIAIIATFCFIKKGHFETTINISNILMQDKHDLIHKAVGWMLREVGKRCSEKILCEYLEANYSKMSRTTLRYAIEKLEPNKRIYFLRKDLK